MAIIINDNYNVNAGKPIDSKYLNGQTPWTSILAANAGIPIAYRYTGLTVNIGGTEFWYASGVTDGSLIQKKYSTILPSGSFVTGATNIGFFSGLTGIQTLPIYNFPNPNYNGNYCSLYNYYFRGTDCKIHVGTPSDNIPKRGYVKTELPVKSWVWNNLNDYSQGWILMDGNIANCVGSTSVGVSYYSVPTTYPYTASTWTVSCNNGSNVAIGTPLGSLNTGNTLTIGGPVYATKTNNNLNLRTLQTLTPNVINISNNEAFVYFSGATPIISAINIGTGIPVLKVPITGSTLQFRSISGSGNTTVNQSGNNIIIFSSGNSSIGGLTGQRITKTICQISHGFNKKDVIGWSGGTYNRAIANGMYDGEVIGIVSNVCNANCFDLTQAGYVTGLTGLCTSRTYFLSDVTSGLMTLTEPTTNGHISKSVMLADSSVSGWVLPYAGYVISNGTGGPLIKSVCLPSGSYQMQPTDFFVGACGGNAVYLPTTPPTGMVVVIADVSDSAGSFPIPVIGSIIGCTGISCINTNAGSLSYIFNGCRWNVFAFAPALA